MTDKKQQQALLLHLAGTAVQDAFNTLIETREDYAIALTKLTGYFDLKRNIPSERNQFCQAAQGETEMIEQYITSLKLLAATRDYTEKTDDDQRSGSQTLCIYKASMSIPTRA